ncbi:uncharacterized protein LOC111049027 [Nilaparvata lugens]|uniref:uncharacterized protein LOC111049027 n=1 Tax=Nilaparvata lugens TaxID=108931 RepID=UPI000B986065|nr:uncharacterized protein LOC111049027 [Nilaparvata lugens]XP_022190711.1 uncharacterized protein LOC111049027 [Nilaparvata lugens]
MDWGLLVYVTAAIHHSTKYVVRCGLIVLLLYSVCLVLKRIYLSLSQDDIYEKTEEKQSPNWKETIEECSKHLDKARISANNKCAKLKFDLSTIGSRLEVMMCMMGKLEQKSLPGKIEKVDATSNTDTFILTDWENCRDSTTQTDLATPGESIESSSVESFMCVSLDQSTASQSKFRILEEVLKRDLMPRSDVSAEDVSSPSESDVSISDLEAVQKWTMHENVFNSLSLTSFSKME